MVNETQKQRLLLRSCKCHPGSTVAPAKPRILETEKFRKVTSLIKGALQETLSAKTTIDKGFSKDLMQTALQDSLSAKTLVIIGFDTQLNKNALQDIIDFTDQGTIKSVPDVFKKLIDQKKGGSIWANAFLPRNFIS